MEGPSREDGKDHTGSQELTLSSECASEGEGIDSSVGQDGMTSIHPFGVEKGLVGSMCSAGMSWAFLADSLLSLDVMGMGPSYQGFLAAEPALAAVVWAHEDVVP